MSFTRTTRPPSPDLTMTLANCSGSMNLPCVLTMNWNAMPLGPGAARANPTRPARSASGANSQCRRRSTRTRPNAPNRAKFACCIRRPEDVDFRNTVQPRQAVLHLKNCIIADVELVVSAAWRVKKADHQQIRRLLVSRDAKPSHILGKARARAILTRF